MKAVVHIFRLVAFVLVLIAPLSERAIVHAAEADVAVFMRPHCTTPPCKQFSPYDEHALQTHGLSTGDVVDLDIVLSNPTGHAIQSVQTWLKFDPLVLRGLEVRISDTFPLVAPGEQTFDAVQGIVRIGASNVTGGIGDKEIIVARVKFDVLAEPSELVSLVFHEFSLLGSEGKTKALIVEKGRTVNVLKTRPQDVYLNFGDDLLPSDTFPPPEYMPEDSDDTPIPGIPSGEDDFMQLQASDLRVATQGGDVFAVWQQLKDPRVRGYNLYYGTVTGRYILRRTVPADAAGVTLRNLPEGKKYYFALTAYDAQGRETDFSYEVAAVVGDSGSSTAPVQTHGGLSANSSPPSSGGLAGGTGLPLTAVMLITLVSFGVSFYFLKRNRS